MSNVCYFENIGMCFYDELGFRPPLKGEFYLSGAAIEAWRAPCDLKQPYYIVKPTHHAYRNSVFRVGEPVKL